MSRDPIGEAGGRNCYQFAENDCENGVDMLGCWSDKLRQCVNASKFTIRIIDGLERSAAYKGIVVVVISAQLDHEKCDCVCEFPDFKQDARDYQFWDDGRAPTPGEYYKDHLHGGTYYDDSDKPQRFYHMMLDMPGLYEYFPRPDVIVRLRDPPVVHFKSDMFTQVICTKGTESGAVIKMVKWGVEVTQYRDNRGARTFTKSWWPVTNGDKTF